MYKKLLEIYKTPLLISLTLIIVVIALRVERDPIYIAYIILGSFFGTFFLDLDYIIYAYFVDPKSEFAKSVTGFIKHSDLLGALNFIYYHRHDIKEKTLNSALFQVVLAAVTWYITASSTSIFFRVFILSAFLNSIYRFAENYFEGRAQDWFWSLQMNISRNSIAAYSVGLILVFLYCLTLVSA